MTENGEEATTAVGHSQRERAAQGPTPQFRRRTRTCTCTVDRRKAGRMTTPLPSPRIPTPREHCHAIDARLVICCASRRAPLSDLLRSHPLKQASRTSAFIQVVDPIARDSGHNAQEDVFTCLRCPGAAGQARCRSDRSLRALTREHGVRVVPRSAAHVPHRDCSLVHAMVRTGGGRRA